MSHDPSEIILIIALELYGSIWVIHIFLFCDLFTLCDQYFVSWRHAFFRKQKGFYRKNFEAQYLKTAHNLE